MSQANEPIEVKETDEAEEACSICSYPFVLKISLVCGHEFCYLCIKGWCLKTLKPNNCGSCPLCRASIDMNFINNYNYSKKDLSTDSPDDKSLKKITNWMYSGNKGYWAFDPTTTLQLEDLYQKYLQQEAQSPGTYDFQASKIRIGSLMYSYDFANMLQISENNKTRRIVRNDNVTDDMVKGIAGLRLS